MWYNLRLAVRDPDGELDIRVNVLRHSTFGCYINVATSLYGPSFEDTFGLLGTPNGNGTDEWTTADAELFPFQCPMPIVFSKQRAYDVL